MTRNKLYLAAALLLLALGILLRPSSPRSGVAAASAEGSRAISRDAKSTPAPAASRRKREFRSLAKLYTGDQFPKLTPQEIQTYLQAQNRNVDALLAVFRMTQDKAFLTEALEKFPNHPHVLFCLLQVCEDPAKRLELLDSFKRADPENGIGNFLAARTLIDLGRDEEAVAELLKSSGKPIKDFTEQSSQNFTEAYLSAGFSPLEARVAGHAGSMTSWLMLMGDPVWKKLEETRLDYESSGNVAGVQSLRDIQFEMGRTLQQDGSLLDSMIGLVYEKKAWKGIDSPESAAFFQEVDQRTKTLREYTQKFTTLVESPAVPEADWLLYFDRVKLFGEKAAVDWLLEKHPQP
ncbi:MAG: hypothetical protein V4584_15895 [Verrucomicrobiota bacterium]